MTAKQFRMAASRFVLPVTMTGLWQLIAVCLEKPTVLPQIDMVAAVLFHPTAKILITGSLLDNTMISLARVMLGFLLATGIAVPMGLMMGYFPVVERFVDFTVEMFRPIPPLAWVPLILAWFGIKGLADLFPSLAASPLIAGIQYSTVLIIFIGASFPILLSTIQGVKNIPVEYLESSRTLGAKKFFLMFKVIIPAALPLIVTGLRIGLGIGWMCLVAAEMMPGSNCGLGYLIWYAYELLRADIIVAGMIVIGLIGFLMDRCFRLFEQRLNWHNKR
jgi:NitT/TauT family transport system permease protein